jgi:phosphomevalonate kinase
MISLPTRSTQRPLPPPCPADCSTVSCPGKVLIAGGYLVTQEGLPGLVLSSTARFYCTAAVVGGAGSASLAAALAAHDWQAVALAAPVAVDDPSQPPTPLPVLVRSPQFHTKWRYSVDAAGPAALRLTPAAADHRNTYVEWAVNVALLVAGGHVGPATLAAAVGALASSGCTLELDLHADNDFYSQRAHLEAAGLPVTTANLAVLPRFNPCPVDPVTGKAVVNKTGLGSSAALVTSAVGAVLSLLGVVSLGEGSGDEGGSADGGRQYGLPSRAASLRLVHDVAQTAHCLAQGKVREKGENRKGGEMAGGGRFTRMRSRARPAFLAYHLSSLPHLVVPHPTSADRLRL